MDFCWDWGESILIILAIVSVLVISIMTCIEITSPHNLLLDTGEITKIESFTNFEIKVSGNCDGNKKLSDEIEKTMYDKCSKSGRCDNVSFEHNSSGYYFVYDYKGSHITKGPYETCDELLALVKNITIKNK